MDTNNIDSNLLNFIQEQKLMVIATTDEKNKPWICNVYYSSDNDLNFYIVSPSDTNHSRHLIDRPEVAFSIVWYDKNNLSNRLAIQGKGKMVLVKGVSENIAALKVHHKKYPEWKEFINWENMVKKVIESKIYKITPTYMKFWNDELYGEEGIEEFNLN